LTALAIAAIEEARLSPASAPMKVLIDECEQIVLKAFLSKQVTKCITVQEAGWDYRTLASSSGVLYEAHRHDGNFL
jgi:hypothetical protein